MFERAERRRRWPTGRIAALLILIAVGGWLYGFVRFVDAIPRERAVPGSPVDAIVVLTGGAGRLSEGIELLRGKAGAKLFVSGVYRGVEVAELLRFGEEAPAEIVCCIALGYGAGDTRGNAEETAAWMAKQGYRSLRLVTANYHMPRSLVEFRRAMPQAVLEPHPVIASNVRLDGWWQFPGTARLVLGEYVKLQFALARIWLEGGPPAATGGAP